MLPAELRATPNNGLLEEVERSYNFNDPIAVQAETGREVYYFSAPFFKFLMVSQLMDSLLQLPINMTGFYEILNFYGLGTMETRRNNGA